MVISYKVLQMCLAIVGRRLAVGGVGRSGLRTRLTVVGTGVEAAVIVSDCRRLVLVATAGLHDVSLRLGLVERHRRGPSVNTSYHLISCVSSSSVTRLSLVKIYLAKQGFYKNRM